MLKEYMRVAQPSTAYVRNIRVDYVTFSRWERYFESKTLSLPSDLTELEHQVYMARKKSNHQGDRQTGEREAWRRTCAVTQGVYSELRNEALHELLKIGREQYGIDLLKKLAPSSGR